MVRIIHFALYVLLFLPLGGVAVGSENDSLPAWMAEQRTDSGFQAISTEKRRMKTAQSARDLPPMANSTPMFSLEPLRSARMPAKVPVVAQKPVREPGASVRKIFDGLGGLVQCCLSWGPVASVTTWLGHPYVSKLMFLIVVTFFVRRW